MLDVTGLETFYGRAKILHGVSLNVGAGEVVALLGRNGAGKSTTMKSIMGLVRPTAGEIRYENSSIRGLAPHRICQRRIGYVPEDRRIFATLSVEENLEVGRRPAAAGEQPWTFERLFALFPNLAERRENLGSRLSGGEQQMLTIARTLMGNPKLILLDEPSEGIAPVIVEQMAKVIDTLKADGLSILLSEQNLHFARLVSDKAVVIETGSVRYAGSFQDLDAHPEIGRQYLAV
ncbi:MAG: ABC transporter ATP-binding protein [Pseudomonadota bacterium]